MPEPMSDEEREHFRGVLEQRRDGVEADLRAALEDSDEARYVDLAGQVGDLEDRALADLLVDENLASMHRHIRDLREIDAAIARVERGDYGECVDCGEAIGAERLEAYPTAERCIDCQALYERTHAHEGHPTL